MPDLKTKFARKQLFTRLSHPVFFNSVLLVIYLVFAWHRKSFDPGKWSPIDSIPNDISDLIPKSGKHLPIKSNERVSFSDSRLIFKGWGEVEPGHRWSIFPQASILFKMSQSSEPLKGRLTLSCSALGNQQVTVVLNGAVIYAGRLVQKTSSIDIDFDPKLMRTNGEYNHLLFSLPDAHYPGNSDRRLLGISLSYLSLV